MLKTPTIDDPRDGAVAPAAARPEGPAGAAWLILPTYNEAENLERIVRAADAVLREAAPMGHRILVVDDGSPDGTGMLADDLAVLMPTVCVLHRPAKAGLGRAYLAGFETALNAGAAHVLEMDADFSHSPADLARLLEASFGADLVLGSRYVKGGGVSDWGVLRRAVSRGGCLYARWVLGVSVQDLTCGFKCFRREVLEGVDLTAVRALGYAFQVELTYRASLAGFRIEEIPITFRERTDGTSKMSLSIALEAVWRIPQLRLRTRERSELGLPVPERASAA